MRGAPGGDIMAAMQDELAVEVGSRCRHTLRDGECPSCGWRAERDEGPLPPHEPDGLPSIGGW